MVKGLYTAWTGLRNEQRRMDVIANNIANADTTGYKKVSPTAQSFDRQLAIRVDDDSDGYLYKGIDDISLGVKIGETYNDFSQGSFRESGGTYDLALEGSGFFTISMTDKAGTEHIRYSRDGAFTVTTDGFLVTKDGDYVLGQNNQRIQIPGAQTAQVSIDTLGNIYADENFVARLQIVDFDNYEGLTLYGENQYDALPVAGIRAGDAYVRQGYLEMSNVNVINEMVTLITVSRAYETNQKMMQTIDSTLDKAVNDIGKL
ncbi:MAG: flagellar hook-basal body protein [Lachnospiraceae bacterium]|nr:flagellar hook-basal body protein [Lachnospiraceae bacterium]